MDDAVRGRAPRARGPRSSCVLGGLLVIAVVRTRWVRLHRSPRRPSGLSRLTALRAPRTRGLGGVSRCRRVSGPGRPPGGPGARRSRAWRALGGVRRSTPGTSRVLTAAWCPRPPRARPCRLSPRAAWWCQRSPPWPSSPRAWRSRATRPAPCATPVGLGGQAHGTARRRQRVPVMGWPSPRGRAASRGLWGEEENQRHRDTTRSVAGPRASQPLWQPCDGGRSMREDALHDKEPHMKSIILMDWYPNMRWINGIAIHRNDGW